MPFQKVKKVIGIEVNTQAIKDAKTNADLNGFFCFLHVCNFHLIATFDHRDSEC